ncbi:hypothetical protein GCM10009677_38200 [Sphaerisporangium rubeum]|uniref:Uncharacterized protein n=1 Tax=Sphaerisporangium rubeum TaxID=321317 RepID=A0A7X0IE29_9ACTN|nr:hypothetical protein [Sphaerisporangium rubeum]
MHLRHRWKTIEAIGRVVTQRCEVCGKIRVRVRRPDPPPGTPTHRESAGPLHSPTGRASVGPGTDPRARDAGPHRFGPPS